MCSPPKPSTPTINPYQGFGANDPRFQDAVSKLGIKNLDSQNDINAVNQYILEQDFEYARRNPQYQEAVTSLIDDGTLTAKDKEDSRYLSQVQTRLNDFEVDADIAEQKAEADKQAQEYRDQLDEMMRQSQLINNPRQGPVAPVTAPIKMPKPIPVAPPTPRMEIERTPPAPELVQGPNKMAIVKQSASARSRQRMRTRGTASLSA